MANMHGPIRGLLLAVAAVATSAQGQPTQPSPEMKRLIDAMKGTWSIRLTYEPTKAMPKGAVAQGREVWRAGPGGMSLIEDETSTGPTGRWDGMSVTWWDPDARGYRAIWCDNHQRAGCLVMKKAAKWQGNDFVLGDEWQQGGKTMEYKEVMSDLTSNSFVLTTYMGEAGSSLEKETVLRGTRVSR